LGGSFGSVPRALANRFMIDGHENSKDAGAPSARLASIRGAVMRGISAVGTCRTISDIDSSVAGLLLAPTPLATGVLGLVCPETTALGNFIASRRPSAV